MGKSCLNKKRKEPLALLLLGSGMVRESRLGDIPSEK